MLRIYQIGNYRVNLVPSSNQGLTNAAPVSFRRPADELTGVSGDVSYTMPGRPLVKAGKLKVEGALICGATETCASVDQQFSHLLANGGDVVPIIGVIPPECCPCVNCNGAGCEQCNTYPESMWLLTYGTVTDYSADYQQDYGAPFGNGELNVSMTIEGPTYWEPLNDVEWRYWGNSRPYYADSVSAVTKYFHPYNPVWNSPPLSGFQYINNTYMFYPENWIRAYSSVRSRRQRAVLLSNDPATPTQTLSNGLPLTHSFSIPLAIWPAQPRSMYYFSNLPQEGTLTIEVESITQNGLVVENTATLDLSVLNTNTNLSGISPADSIIAGNFYDRYNGYYLLGGNTPVSLYIPWERDGLYPGETLVGKNTVTVSITDTDIDLDFAYAHILRRY